MFEAQLCIKLGITRAELHHGRGALMPLEELTVFWPAYFATEARIEAERQREIEREQERQRRRIH